MKLKDKSQEERDKEFAEATKIIEKLTMQGANEIVEELMKYPPKQIIESKHKRLKIKVTIV